MACVRTAGLSVVAVAACVVAATVNVPAAGAAPGVATAAVAGSNGGVSVIVVLKNQLVGVPATAQHVGARRVQARNAQSAVLARLGGGAVSHVINYTVGNAFSATVTVAQARQLAADPAVAAVTPNVKVPVPPATAKVGAPGSGGAAAPARPATVDPGVCSSDRAKPKLEPEALQTLHVRSDDPSARTAAALGIDGSGVKVAFIADGINPNNAGFARSNGRSAIVDYKDFYGDGPDAPTSGAEAFGDASSVAAQGGTVYDVADFANPKVVAFPGGHCYIRIVGVAPGASVVALKAGSELLPNSAILQSIDYAVSVDHVNVLNESFGSNAYPDAGARNTIQLFNDQAVAAGVTVTASSGDAGISSTIGTPATDPLVVSTGASTDSRIYEQTGYALATRFGNGRWQDNNTSALSSAGVTQNGRTVDVQAPGEADWAVCDASGRFSGCTSFGNPAHSYVGLQSFGGTSQSAPLTAGVAALVIQAYRTTHAGASPTPAVVKRILTSTARDLVLPGEQQGSGLVDARAAVEAAFTWPGGSRPVPGGVSSNVALSSNQLTLTGAPGSTVSGRVGVTNVGTKTLSVVANTRRYALLASHSQTVSIAKTAAQTTPYPTNAVPWAYKKVTFDVGSGVDELSSVIRWRSGATYNGAGPVVRMSLFDPSGAFATNTRPQGGPNPSNYGLVTVRRPAPGTWTAVLYTSSATGFTGPVGFITEQYRAIPVGSVTPIVSTIAPGATTTVTAALPVPSVGGDTVYTMSVASSDGHQVAVPIVVRALVATSAGGRFAGVITGGNARSYAPAQTFSYAFDVPAHEHSLTVGVTVDPAYLLEGVLVDPNGEVPSINSNQTHTAAGTPTQGATMQNTVAHPAAGRWRYVVIVQSPVSGNELNEPFTGTVSFNKITASPVKLPSHLKVATTIRQKITVTNHGAAPLLLQTDARAGAARQFQLAPQFAGSTLQLPQDVTNLSQLPAYLVAPQTSSLSLTAASTSPAQVELSSPAGGIDLFGDLRAAQGGNTVSTATDSDTTGPVGLGYWSAYVQQIGPFTDAGAPTATSQLTATAVMTPFDTDVTTSTGDPFLQTLDPTASPGKPIVIAAGTTATITVSITPTAARGSHVTGVLNLVTTPITVANLFNTTGEVLTTLPYHYTVT